MRRREFFKLVGGAGAWSLEARAQQVSPLRRIDILLAELNEDDPYYERRLAAFMDGLRALGWVEHRDVEVVVHRVKPIAADIHKRIAEVLPHRPDVIVSGGGTTTGPLLQATNNIPVVFTAATDPVGAGFVESLAHPGGNATGFMQFHYSLSGKWLELLKEVIPAVSRAGVIRDASTNSGIGQFAVIQAVAGTLGIDVVPIGTRSANEIQNGMAKLSRDPNAGLILSSGASIAGHRDQILKLAAQHRLPTVYPNRVYVDFGGLISYGADQLASSRAAAGYVDRILKGAKPADLPVQGPTKYDLVINLKTAKASGLELSPALLARANEVIE